MVAILQSPHSCSFKHHTPWPDLAWHAWQCASCLARNSCMGSWLKSREGSAHCTNHVKTSGLVNCLGGISTRVAVERNHREAIETIVYCVCVLTIMQVRNCNWHDKLAALESISIVSASKVLEHDAPKNNTAEGSYMKLYFLILAEYSNLWERHLRKGTNMFLLTDWERGLKMSKVCEICMVKRWHNSGFLC